MSRLFLLLLLGALAALTLPACSSAGTAQQPVTVNVTLGGAHYRLPNGLEVVLHPDRSLTNVAVNVRYRVGGKDDPPSRSGFAHLFEHLMFLGSRKVSEEGFTKALNDAGALSYNAHTNLDETEYYEIVPPSQLPVALWLEADRMAHPLERVQEATFGRERDVVKNEWREHYDNVPYGHVHSIARGALFPDGHPYHLSTIGRVEDLDRATLDEARAFASRWYQPANATLVVAGDIDVEQTRALVGRMFGAIPMGEPLPAPKAHAFPRLAKDKRVAVAADVDAPRVVVAWPIPPPYAPGFDEIQLAARAIVGMTSHKLQDQSKVARDIGWSVVPGRLGSMLTVTIELERGADPDTAISALEQRVTWTTRLARRSGYRWPEFSDLRTQRMTSRVLGLASLATRAERIQEYLEYWNTPDAAQDDLRHIQAIHAEDAAIATEQLLDGCGKVVVVVRPTPGAPRSGKVAP